VLEPVAPANGMGLDASQIAEATGVSRELVRRSRRRIDQQCSFA
jgi:hypothetical protein